MIFYIIVLNRLIDVFKFSTWHVMLYYVFTPDMSLRFQMKGTFLLSGRLDSSVYPKVYIFCLIKLNDEITVVVVFSHLYT